VRGQVLLLCLRLLHSQQGALLTSLILWYQTVRTNKGGTSAAAKQSGLVPLKPSYDDREIG
jgi:hypothetical protein